MLATKTDRLRVTTADYPPLVHFSATISHFDDFRCILEDVLRTVMFCKSSVVWTRPLTHINYYGIVRCYWSVLIYFFNKSFTDDAFFPRKIEPLCFRLIKMPNLDPTCCQNFIPISNLSFISKTLELSLQLLLYLEDSNLVLEQIIRRKLLFTQISRTYLATDKSKVSLLTVFDISVAFYMVDH